MTPTDAFKPKRIETKIESRLVQLFYVGEKYDINMAISLPLADIC